MSNSQTNINLNAILWLKSELDKTLTDARSALDFYIENPTDMKSGKDALALYKLAYGVLKMARIRGGELLLHELIAVMNDLLAGRIRRREDALDTVMQATIQLPDYLEYLQAGNADVPIVLLPLLNDMRATRDAELLSDSILELDELKNDNKFYAQRKSSGESVQKLAQALRGVFQKSLLEWYQSRDSVNNLLKLAAVFFRLGNASQHVNSRRLWLVSQSVVEAIQCGDLETSIAIKSLLGKVDRQMKRLIVEGEETFDASIPIELVKNLLFYVAAANSGNKTVDRVKEIYKLNELLPDGGSIETARANLRGANPDIYQSLTKAVIEDINGIKERLEVYAFADKPEADILRPVVGKLNELAETNGMLGQADERERLLQSAKKLEAALQAESILSREELQDIASVLIDVEIAIKSYAGEENQLTADIVPEQEYRKVYHAVIQETLSELGKVRAATLDYLERYKNYDLLKPVPPLLQNIRGAMKILPLQVVEPLLVKLEGYVASLIHHQEPPRDEQLAAFADGLSSIEFYLESLEPGIGDQQDILEIGKASLAQLDDYIVDFDTPEEPNVEQAIIESPAIARGGKIAALTPGMTSAELDMAEMLEFDAMQLQPDGAQSTADSDQIQVLDQSIEGMEKLDQLADLEEQPASAMEIEDFGQDTPLLAPTSSMEIEADLFAGLKVLPNSVDQEILEIFLEEAGEEQEKIAENLSLWIANNNDMDAMAILRRSFHTLKGSGRLVGAEVMGEFAWSLEGLLNRLMDKSVAPTVEVISTLEAARDALPLLIQQITTREAPESSVSTVKRHADILTKGGTLDAIANQHGEVPKDITVIIDPADETSEIVEQQAPSLPESFDGSIEVFADQFDETGEMVDPRAAALTMTGMDHFPTLSADDTGEIAVEAGALDKLDDSMNLQVVVLSEVEEQLEYIDAQLAKAKEFNTDLTLDAPLISAVQTLNNVARTADIPQIYSVFAHVEHYLDYCANKDRGIDAALPRLLELASKHVHTVLATIKNGDEATYIDSAVTTHLEELLQLEHKAVLREYEASELELGEQVLAEDEEIEVDVLEMPDNTQVNPIASVAADFPKTEMGAAHDDTETPDIIHAQDAELIGIFLEESREILDACESLTTDWADQSDDAIVVKEIQRHLHTLKGGARMAGIDNIGNLSHSLESLFDAVVEKKVSATQEVIYLVRTSFDTLGIMVNSAEKGQPVFPASGLQQDIENIVQPPEVVVARGGPDVQPTPNVGVPSFYAQDTQVSDPYADPFDGIGTIAQEVSPVIPDPSTETTVLDADEPIADELEFTAEMPAPVGLPNTEAAPVSGRDDVPVRHESIKVNPVLLDELVNQAGEINIFHSRIDEQIKQTGGRLEELQQTIARLSAQLRNLENEAEAQILSTFKRDEKFDPDADAVNEEFDPLELDRYSTIQQLSRSLAESISDLTSLEEMVGGNLSEIETLLLQKSRISTDLQEGLMRTRLVPFSIQLPRLQRIVRQTSTELNKEVELVISGENSELDRKLLDSMVAPLEHLLRNAVAHGIETPDERMGAGKNRSGTIEISIKRNGPEIELVVSDDGSGINIESVREKALSRNLLEADSDLEDEEVLQFILESGFSTSSSVDQISGRGVGLDIVNHEIKKLNGDLRITSEAGKGTSFRVNLPFTLAINQSLLIQSGEDMFAVPVSSIYGVIRMQPDKIARQLALDEPVIDYGGTTYALRHLGSMLNRKLINMNTVEDQLPLLLVNTGDHRVAFLADAVLGSREIVVKPLGPPLNNLVEYSGATILGDGNVALILDMPGVVRTTSSGKSSLFSAAAVEEERPLVMVVDDSITIRKVTSRVLERNNYQVLTAKDGMDALQQLNDQKPDLMLLDVEMPRMDGFELAAKIRQSDEHKNLPIIMITSRTGKKHKERAAQIGVNRYLGKPFQEELLLREISSLLKQET